MDWPTLQKKNININNGQTFKVVKVFLGYKSSSSSNYTYLIKLENKSN